MIDSLGEYADIVLGGTPKTSVPDYWDGDILWVTPGDMGDTKHIESTERRITSLGLSNSNTKLLEVGDVIVSARGTVGKIVRCHTRMAFNQSCYAVKTKDNNVLDQEFLYYLMGRCVDHLRQNSYGAVFKSIIKTTLEEHLF